MKKKVLALTLLLTQGLLAKDIEINHSHLNDLVGDPDAIFKPIAIQEEEIDATLNRVGARKRVVITYSKVTQADIESTFTVSPDGDATYQFYNEEMNGLMADNLELRDSHVIAIEYFVTNNFSLELSDTYRRYDMDGRQVGIVEGSNGGLLSGPTTNQFGFNQESQIHDIQIGAKYSVKVIDIPNFELELSGKGTIGVVHMNATSSIEYGIGERQDTAFNDFAGYSFGVGAGVKATLFDSFFIEGRVEQRNYVMAPMSHDNGISHQVDQDGLLFFLGVGFQF